MLCVLPGRLITSKLLSLPHSLLYNWRSHRHPPASLEQKEKKKRASIRSPNKPATPKKKTATLPEEQQQPPKQNKQKARIPTRFQRERAKRFPTNYNFKPKSTTLGRTQFKCSRPDTREWQRDKENRKTDGDKERAERRRARQRARERAWRDERTRERERERTWRSLRERNGRARTQLVELRETEL